MRTELLNLGRSYRRLAEHADATPSRTRFTRRPGRGTKPVPKFFFTENSCLTVFGGIRGGPLNGLVDFAVFNVDRAWSTPSFSNSNDRYPPPDVVLDRAGDVGLVGAKSRRGSNRFLNQFHKLGFNTWSYKLRRSRRPNMASASYYREQARLLLQWASDAHDPAVIERLTASAQDMLATAQRLHQMNAGANFDACDFFNSLQMTNGRSNR
jgi:hypothetical protein